MTDGGSFSVVAVGGGGGGQGGGKGGGGGGDDRHGHVHKTPFETWRQREGPLLAELHRLRHQIQQKELTIHDERRTLRQRCADLESENATLRARLALRQISMPVGSGGTWANQ
jgi:hypothetical protein